MNSASNHTISRPQYSILMQVRISLPCLSRKALTDAFEVPHIGHLYSLVVADIFARHARLTMPTRPVHFITGTDEHGLKIQKAAQDRNMEPQELCDHLGLAFSVRSKSLLFLFNLTSTSFSRA